MIRVETPGYHLPSLRDSGTLVWRLFPGVETPGYHLPSLRDSGIRVPCDSTAVKTPETVCPLGMPINAATARRQRTASSSFTPRRHVAKDITPVAERRHVIAWDFSPRSQPQQRP
jgi:hypothetical protein